MPKPKKNLSRKSRGARAMARKRRMIFAAREEAINQLNYTATKEQLRELKSKLAERKYYFTDQQTQVLLQTICDTVKDQPACFEKPTSEIFYNTIKSKAPILKNFAWTSLRNKMQAIRAWYLETLQWKEKGIDPTLVVNSKRLRNIVKYVEKLSPFWDTLGAIFNHNKIGRPSVVYDTAQDVELKTSTFDSSSNDSNDVQLVLKYEATDPQYSTSQSSSDFTTTIVNRSTLETQTMPQSIMEATQTIADNSAATTTTTPPNTDTSNRNGLIDDNLEFIKLEPDSPQPSMSQRSINFKLSPRETAQPLQNSQLIKEQNSTLEREKIELESEKLKIEREKLELEKEKVRNDFELKKLALQNEFELKKVEIALRVEADERLKRYEIDLKSFKPLVEMGSKVSCNIGSYKRRIIENFKQFTPLRYFHYSQRGKLLFCSLGMNFQNNFNAVANTSKTNSNNKRGNIEARIEARRAWRKAYMKKYRARKKRQTDIVLDQVSAKFSRDTSEDSTPNEYLGMLQQRNKKAPARSRNYQDRQRNRNSALAPAYFQSIETDTISEPDSYHSNDGKLVLKFEAAVPQSSTSQASSDFNTTIANRSTLESHTMRQTIMEVTQTPTHNSVATTTTTHNAHASDHNDLIDNNLEFIKLWLGSPQPSTSQSPFDSAQQLQNMVFNKVQNLALEKEQVELEREKLKMEREKFKLEKEKVRNDFKLKKFALKNELELKTAEIALRAEADERLKKYEIYLKSG
ncbi:uncharacterized protein LOC118742076 [Rhagoletis pomonella]|uniref:uncharacterized protein LOC118742076 n=1 Tax=Rhagoletis pomonella TaxID=28610 RepID=UPI00177BE035|nr:uncharacterized protein LOC118742076 [Rhagoletis pomonella]